MTAVFVLITLLLGTSRKVNCANAVMQGAKEGMKTAAGILPSLLCMLTALACLRASGLSEHLTRLIAPAFSWMGLPPAVLPLFLLRPLSGSASIAMVEEVIALYGPDSPEAVSACVLCASGDTLFYVLAVYTGACNVTKTRHTVPCALFAWLCGGVMAGLVWRLGQ